MRRVLSGQIKPLFRLGLAFVLVWFFHGLTTSILEGGVQLLAVISLSAGVWLVAMRSLFPAQRKTD